MRIGKKSGISMLDESAKAHSSAELNQAGEGPSPVVFRNIAVELD
jgi:hypothetical protein